MPDDRFLVFYGDSKLGLQVGETTRALNISESWDSLLGTHSADALMKTLSDSQHEQVDLQNQSLSAPVVNQEIWAAGVTYKRSEEAREAESHNSTVYTRVYHAERPELFFKGLGQDAVGMNSGVGIRCDATWSVPEPELVIVLNGAMEVVGFTIGNDMSSRDIEGENPLYLPQAKVYEKSCALGPRIWLQPGCTTWPDLTIKLTIKRSGQIVFQEETSTANLKRTLSQLVEYLGRCKKFANGVYLFTGTGIVPPDSFTLQAGDEVRIAIEPIGELVNIVEVVGK